MEQRRLYREAGDPVSGRSLSLVFIPILLYAAAFLFVRVEAQQSSKAVMLFIARPLDTLNKNLFALRDPERTKHIYQTMIPHVTTAFSGGARSYTSHSHKTRKWSLPSINHLGSGGNALNFQVLGTAPGGLIDIETFDLSWDYVPLKLSNPIDPPLSPTDTELDPYNPSYPGVVVKEVPQDASDPYRVPNADLYGDEQQVEKQRELAGKLEEQQKEGKHKLGENKKHENDNKPKTVTEFYVSYLFNGGDPIDYFANEQQNTEFLHNVYGGSLTGMNPFTITKVVDTTSTIFGDTLREVGSPQLHPPGGDYFPAELILFINVGDSVHDPFVVLHMPVVLLQKYELFVDSPAGQTAVAKERISFEFPVIYYSYANGIQSLCNATTGQCPAQDPITFNNCGFYAIDQSRINYVQPPDACNGAFPPYPIDYQPVAGRSNANKFASPQALQARSATGEKSSL